MRKVLTMCAIAATFTGLALADSWSGRLMDSTCYHRHGNSRACDATTKTTNFMLDVNGTNYRFDHASNERAILGMRSRADRANNPDHTKAVPVNANVTGRIKADNRMHADILDIQ